MRTNSAPPLVDVKIPGSKLPAAYDAIMQLSSNDVPVTLTVKIRRLREAVTEFFEPFSKQWNALVAEFSDNGIILESHPRFAEWAERSRPFREEEFTLEVVPLLLSDITDTPPHLPAVVISDRRLDVLLDLGLVVENDRDQPAAE